MPVYNFCKYKKNIDTRRLIIFTLGLFCILLTLHKFVNNIPARTDFHAGSSCPVCYVPQITLLRATGNTVTRGT